MGREKFFLREDGISAIVPFREVVMPTVKEWRCAPSLRVPFTDAKYKRQLDYCFRGHIPMYTTLDKKFHDTNLNNVKKAALGVLLFEVTPLSSGFIFVPTSPFSLVTMEKDVFDQFCDYKLYKKKIKEQMISYLKEQGKKIPFAAVRELKTFIHKSSLADFSFDFLLLPTVFPDCEIQFYRPENDNYFQRFNNPSLKRIYHSISPALLRAVESILKNDLPKDQARTFITLQKTALLRAEFTMQSQSRSERRVINRIPESDFIHDLEKLRIALS